MLKKSKTTTQDVFGYYYFVQDSYLSNDGSERIFKVKHNSTEYFYCAFKFRNCVVCPAFLVSWFDLTDYACLDVVHGSHYYYIFLCSKDDNALSHILDKNSHFLGRYFFMVPSKEKILHLNSENKNIKVFIDISNKSLSRNKAFHAELVRYRRTPGTVSQGSKVDPSYWLVPIEAVDAFRGRYCLPASVRCFSAALVHEESESYSEICNYADEDYLLRKENEERGENVGESLQSSFIETDYKREEYIMEKFVSHIQSIFVECKSMKVKAYYCFMFSVIQSSGYGKSKLMLKLGSRMPTFYSSLLRGGGFPYESFFLTRLIKELGRVVSEPVYTGRSLAFCWLNNVTTAVYIYILRILFVILKNPKNTSLKESFQIDSELKKHEFFLDDSYSEDFNKFFKVLFRGLEDICKFPREIPFNGEKTLDLKEIQIVQELSLNKFAIDFRPKEYLTNDLEGDVMALLESLKIKGTDLPSIFVIDEYHGLWCEETKRGMRNYIWCFRDTDVNTKTSDNVYRRSPFNVFRRVFRMFSNTWGRLMLIVTGTRGHASMLQSKKELDLCKLPMASHRIIKNFPLLQTYSANSDISINADMFPNDEGICNWMDFLKSNFRKVEYFKFGRPLNYAAYRDLAFLDVGDFKAKFEECREFKFMKSKLFGCKKIEKTDKIGLLYSMFNFAFGIYFLPSCVDRADLVENHLMTLMEFLDEREEEEGGGNQSYHWGLPTLKV